MRVMRSQMDYVWDINGLALTGWCCCPANPSQSLDVVSLVTLRIAVRCDIEGFGVHDEGL
jgi:hypothetical protein